MINRQAFFSGMAWFLTLMLSHCLCSPVLLSKCNFISYPYVLYALVSWGFVLLFCSFFLLLFSFYHLSIIVWLIHFIEKPIFLAVCLCWGLLSFFFFSWRLSPFLTILPFKRKLVDPETPKLNNITLPWTAVGSRFLASGQGKVGQATKKPAALCNSSDPALCAQVCLCLSSELSRHGDDWLSILFQLLENQGPPKSSNSMKSKYWHGRKYSAVLVWEEGVLNLWGP